MDAAVVSDARDIARSTLDASLDVVDDAQAKIDQLHRSGLGRRRLGRLLLISVAIGVVIIVVRGRAPARPPLDAEPDHQSDQVATA